MTPNNFPARRIGGLALAIGSVTLVGMVALILFFAVGGGFGMLNDVCNGVEAILKPSRANCRSPAIIFWIGYALPIMVVIGPLRLPLLARGWKTLR